MHGTHQGNNMDHVAQHDVWITTTTAVVVNAPTRTLRATFVAALHRAWFFVLLCVFCHLLRGTQHPYQSWWVYRCNDLHVQHSGPVYARICTNSVVVNRVVCGFPTTHCHYLGRDGRLSGGKHSVEQCGGVGGPRSISTRRTFQSNGGHTNEAQFLDPPTEHHLCGPPSIFSEQRKILRYHLWQRRPGVCHSSRQYFSTRLQRFSCAAPIGGRKTYIDKIVHDVSND